MGRRASGALAAVALFAILLASCSLLVDGDLGDVHCLDEGKVGPPSCADGDVCSGGLCIAVKPPPSKLGMSCSADVDCGSDEICLVPSAFGGVGEPVCTKTCCSSDECDAPSLNLVCWSEAGGSGRFCREASKVSIASVGAALAGGACATGADCRSGQCAGSHCLDTCCSDTSCIAGGAENACRFGPASAAHGSWYCTAAAPKLGDFLATCAADADCASGLCLPISGALRCSMSCCESGTCGTIELAPGMQSLLGCTEVLHEGAYVRACASVLPSTAMGAIGTECKLDEDCRGGVCLPAIGPGSKRSCSDACCIDANCMDPAFSCRPHAQGATWALRCEH